MSLRSNGSYIGPRPAGPSTSVASGIWDLRTVYRERAADNWPGQPPSDPDFASVSLLLHMDGSNGSTTFSDSSNLAVTITAAGDAQISTADSKFGGASAYFDGTDDYLSVPTGTHVNFGTSDFAVECWVRASSWAGVIGIWGTQDNSSSNAPIMRLLSFDGVPQLVVRGGLLDPAATYNYSSTLASNTWHHIAMSRSSGVFRGYLDGARQFEQTPTAATLDISLPLFIGAWNIDGSSLHHINGYIDDFRITKGTARGYTGATIPVPTAAFPNQ